MYDRELVLSLMVQVRESLLKIIKRSADIKNADDFIDSDDGEETLDSICMLFIAIGENLKQVEKVSGGILKNSNPDADWSGAIGFRDIIAHQYFQVDHEEVFSIIQSDLNSLLNAVEKFIKDSEK
jgi:uncharacterized protein with HEPN domain